MNKTFTNCNLQYGFSFNGLLSDSVVVYDPDSNSSKLSENKRIKDENKNILNPFFILNIYHMKVLMKSFYVKHRLNFFIFNGVKALIKDGIFKSKNDSTNHCIF